MSGQADDSMLSGADSEEGKTARAVARADHLPGKGAAPVIGNQREAAGGLCKRRGRLSRCTWMGGVGRAVIDCLAVSQSQGRPGSEGEAFVNKNLG